MSIHPGPFHPLRAEDMAAMCEGKQPFTSAKTAHRVAKRRKHVCEVYRCRFCGMYHLGTPIARDRKGVDLSAKPRRKIRNRNGVRRVYH